jgi:hypothetical protein
MQTLTALVKLAAVAIASLFVGSPMAPVADPVTDATEPQTGTEGSGGSGSGGNYGSTSNSQPANKIAAAGSTIEYMCASVGDQPCKTTVTLFDETIKVSGPKDLLIEVNAECALWTQVEVVDDDDGNTPAMDIPESRAEAHVNVTVVMDGVPIGVTEYSGDGSVVFCDRVHGMTLRENDGDEDNETISNYLQTRSANSFSWIVLNAGNYPGNGLYHHVEVFASLDAHNDLGEGSSEAAVGKRTLIVEPVGMANNEQL